jgi:hypothetical protein
MLVSDQEKDLTETCGLTSDQAMNLLQPLHAMIDTELENNKNVITPKYLATCEDSCHCGLYSDLANNKQLKDDLFKKAESFPKKQLIFCAQKTAKWFCKDSLLNTLKTEQEPSPSNGL